MTGPETQLTVTALRESPRSPGRYTLELSDGQRFTVGVVALDTLRLTRTGVVVDPETLSRLTRESAVGSLVDRAVGMLARARRTRRELEVRLQRREPDRELIDAAMQRLDALGVLDDAAVARAEAASRLRRGDGPTRVRQLLRQKGVDERTSRIAVSTAVEEDIFDEQVACRQVAERRVRSLQALEPPIARRRLTAFLLRRGYGSTIVRRIVDELLTRRH